RRQVRPGQAQPAGRLDDQGRVASPRGERGAVQPAPRSRLPVDRMPAVHQPGRRRRGPALGPLARQREDRVRSARAPRDHRPARGAALVSAPVYPVFLKLAALPVVVVGGGEVATHKVAGLIAAGARVTIVAPAITAALRARPDVTLVERAFAPADLDGARWVVAAATPAVNREVAAAAGARNLFVNAVDDPEPATAYLGGVVRRAAVTVAISTGGGAPALAGLLREALDAILPDDLERWIDVARAARADWKARAVAMAERRPLLLRALNLLYTPAPAADAEAPR